ncbi:helix-turn-helix domain-containing protein [Sinorhizobium meliloti]|nr:helix-turn-helix domain-containing protein [Sinorhizobium meliloti]MDW9918500.1 helix-turn-helix domain-containing protein [Sinorhizobium meliloti]MDW9949646.1 helix-turn-helix domain-containing protein [Sinorhizobium meliloti]
MNSGAREPVTAESLCELRDPKNAALLRAPPAVASTGECADAPGDQQKTTGSCPTRSLSVAEFRLEQTSLRIDTNVKVVKSSQGFGWTNMFAALTDEQPHEALHGAVPAVWFATTFTPIDVRRSAVGLEQHQEMPANLVSITASGEAVHDEIGVPLEAMHVFLRQEVLHEVAGELYSDREAKRRILSIFGANDPALRLFMSSIRASLDEPPQSNVLKMDYLSHALAVHLLNRHSTAGSPNRAPKAAESLNARQLGAVDEYIATNLASNLTVNELAAVAGLGRVQFLRRFKAATLLTPYQYVISRRVRRAKVLLADKRLDYPSIAFICGFASQGHFVSTFKRLVGATPGEYRRASA